MPPKSRLGVVLFNSVPPTPARGFPSRLLSPPRLSVPAAARRRGADSCGLQERFRFVRFRVIVGRAGWVNQSLRQQQPLRRQV